MSDTLFFSVKTIGLSTYRNRKPQSLLQAAKHNLREDQKERGARSHIDPVRSDLNQIIAGPATPAEVAALARSLMDGAGVVMKRKDYTQAFELLFSLPANTAIDTGQFFSHCLRWATDQFGLACILSAAVHHDEPAPHCHILILPLIDGRYMGSKLIERTRLAKLRDSFAKLASGYGLKEPTRRLYGARQEQTARLVLAHLESTQDTLLQSVLWFTFKQDIEGNPARYAAALGIVVPDKVLPVKKIKTMVATFTGTGKGPKSEQTRKPIGFQKPAVDDVLKPIGFENGVGKHRNHTCVGFAPKAPPPAPTKPPPEPRPPAPAPALPSVPLIATDDRLDDLAHHQITEISVEDPPFIETTTRHHDSDQDPARFHDGEYRPPAPPAPRRHRQAVDAALSSLATKSKAMRPYRH